MTPPIWFGGTLAVLVAGALLLPGTPRGGAALRGAGWILVAAGLALNVAGSRRFERIGTPIRPGRPATHLVTDGVFRLSRNPMYLGMVAALGGIALALGRPEGAIVAPAFGAFLARVYVRPEEAHLALRFGPRWDAYRRRVRRWL